MGQAGQSNEQPSSPPIIEEAVSVGGHRKEFSMPNGSSNQKIKNQQELVERVAKRVWELWQEDLRRDRERRGKLPNGKVK